MGVVVVTVCATLPRRLRLVGSFPVAASGPTIRLISPDTPDRNETATDAGRQSPPRPRFTGARWIWPTDVLAELDFDAPTGAMAEERLLIQDKQSVRLQLQLNRLFRWYRATYQDPGVTEVSRSAISPFTFRDAAGRVWADDLSFEPMRRPRALQAGDPVRRAQLLADFASGDEPEVADLALVDAATAFDAGRFREAVLLCWSAIDATFTRRFEQLVDERLAGDLGEARKFLKGLDFGLRHKMTTGLRLLTGRSFYDLPGNFWDRLTESYRARNRIIHEGATASEDESKRSIEVARELVRAVREL